MGVADSAVVVVLRVFLEEARRLIGDRAVAAVGFGSRVWGGYDEGSDYDVLLVHTASQREGEEAAAEAALMASARLGVGVEAIAATLSEFIGSSRLLIEEIRERGVLYDGGVEIQRVEAIDLLALAEEYLEMAELLAASSMHRGAVDHAYNAAELAVKALLLWDGHKLPKSHGGVVGEFGRLYVLTGKFSRKLGRSLAVLLEKRNRARYDPRAELDEEDSRRAIETARSLVGEVKKVVTERE